LWGFGALYEERKEKEQRIVVERKNRNSGLL
jgi:hypothetical protein